MSDPDNTQAKIYGRRLKRSNRPRANAAACALCVHAEERNGAMDVSKLAEPIATQIQDLITDLLHLSDKHGVDVDKLIRMARMHWEEER